MSSIQDNREAVITIQGGGVYGFTLLGQLQAVIEDHKYVPLAFAGTSAGAIVAALSWAGFSPSEIRDEYVNLIRENKLTELFGPPMTAGFDFAKLEELNTQLKNVLLENDTFDTPGFLKKVQKRLTSIARGYRLLVVAHKLVPHLHNRGFFTGEALQKHIDDLLRKKIDMPLSIAAKNELLCFQHVEDVMRARRDSAYHPPLLLTATNLTKGRLEIINSVDYKYANVPIAKAVRASAGFPVFFTPQEMPEGPYGGGWFVDGGLVSNFPMWTFSDAFRSQIKQSRMFDIYGHIVNRPWIRIGLRVVDDDTEKTKNLANAGTFFQALTSMLTGGTRNQLEEILAFKAPRSLIIKQPYSKTGGPSNCLNVAGLTEEKVKAMVKEGRDFAQKEITRRRNPGVISAKTTLADSIMSQLSDMVKTCSLVFQYSPEVLAFRANVFMPIVSAGEHKMKLLFSFNMDKDGDRDMEFPDLHSGATGFCYSSRRPLVANLESISKLRKDNPIHYAKLFGMDPDLQGKVQQGRTWLACVPIFDPYEVRFDTRRGKTNPAPTKYEGQEYYGLETEIDGPVLGILNLDAGWNYGIVGIERDPNQHFSDPRVQAVMAIMQASSFKIARILIEDFPQ